MRQRVEKDIFFFITAEAEAQGYNCNLDADGEST